MTALTLEVDARDARDARGAGDGRDAGTARRERLAPEVGLPVALWSNPDTGVARYVIFAVLLGSWIVAVAAAGVIIPPVPLLIFLLFRLFRLTERRRHPTRSPEAIRIG
ncbi:hypothetical protein [Actinomadura sp. HBU206391]|uniref:hypothetical protein n=1 Tax=Actinomadura sp. HBU206391 TaxID=2731692 RepID=UPI00164FBFAA|nr:hypothetical protein [Actinomadura sp. HBU206391]MBC6462532.1 hypothetical protein [Actinomadura sp. HBU206391]